MSLEENKAIVHRFIEAYNTRNLDVFDELVAPDYFYQTLQQKGREPFKQLFTMAFETFPDGMKLLKISLLKGIRRGFVLKQRGQIPASGIFLELQYLQQERKLQ